MTADPETCFFLDANAQNQEPTGADSPQDPSATWPVAQTDAWHKTMANIYPKMLHLS